MNDLDILNNELDSDFLAKLIGLLKLCGNDYDEIVSEIRNCKTLKDLEGKMYITRVNMPKENETLKEDIINLENDITYLQKNEQNLISQIDDLNDEIDDLNDEIDYLNDEISELESKINLLNEENRVTQLYHLPIKNMWDIMKIETFIENKDKYTPWEFDKLFQ